MNQYWNHMQELMCPYFEVKVFCFRKQTPTRWKLLTARTETLKLKIESERCWNFTLTSTNPRIVPSFTLPLKPFPWNQWGSSGLSMSCPFSLLKALQQICCTGVYPSLVHKNIDTLLLTMGLTGGSDSKEFVCNVGDLGSIPELRRSPGECNRDPLKFPGLENFLDTGVWQATIHGVAKSQTRLSNFQTQFIFYPVFS